MRWLISLSVMLMAFHSHTVEIVIKTDDDKKTEPEKEEEPDEEEEPPDLPKPAQLNVNIINNTKYEFVVTASVRAFEQEHHGMVVQGKATKGLLTTVGTLYHEKRDTSFEFVEAQVVMMEEKSSHAILCEIKKPEPKDEEEPSKEDGESKEKEQSSEGAPEAEAAEPETIETETETTETVEPTAKKSIDFYLYIPENQTFPICTILFDSVD